MKHVTFPLANLLKEVGFAEPSPGAYITPEILYSCFSFDDDTRCGIQHTPTKTGALAPLYEDAFKWLRERGIYVSVYYSIRRHGLEYSYKVYRKDRDISYQSVPCSEHEKAEERALLCGISMYIDLLRDEAHADDGKEWAADEAWANQPTPYDP